MILEDSAALSHLVMSQPNIQSLKIGGDPFWIAPTFKVVGTPVGYSNTCRECFWRNIHLFIKKKGSCLPQIFGRRKRSH
jgi:hypothetical protein